MNAADFGRVAVMLGGSSSEREVSLDSGTGVLEALRRRGIDAHAFDPGRHDFTEFMTAGFDRVWNALHGPGGEDGVLQGALDWIGMPYTGSGVLASAIAMDKLRSKALFREAGLKTPRWRELAPGADPRPAGAAVGYPLIVKPVSQGSSVGMQRVDDENELAAAVAAARAIEARVMLEQWLDGAEYTVSILARDLLPSIRIETPHTFYDYAAKYEAETTRYYCPGSDDEALEARLKHRALAAFDVLGCSGWGRVDFLLDDAGVPQLIEVNTVPGMTSHSLVPMAAAAVDIDFDELCVRVLETSLAARRPEAA
ncbi:MAG: D-alanine--D-alanine ligase [Pseudomonadota bacterium]